MAHKNSMINKVLSMVLIAVTPGFALPSEFSCGNFAETKNKLYSIMRAYQCETSQGLDSCREFLGLGELGAIAAGVGTAGLIGKSAANRIRNPEFVMCPLGHALLRGNPLKEFFLPTAWADCVSTEPLLKRKLSELANNDLVEINRRIAEQQKQIEYMNEIKEQDKANQALAAPKDKVQELKELQQKLFDEQKKLADAAAALKDTLSSLPADVKQDVVTGIAALQKENLESSSSHPYDRIARAQKSLHEYVDSLPRLSSSQREALKRQGSEVLKNEMGVQIYDTKIKTGGYGSASTGGSPVKYDAKLAGEMKNNLSVLEAQKKKLQEVVDNLAKPLYEFPKSYDRLKQWMLDLVNTNSISANTKTSLHAMDFHIANLEVNPRQPTSSFRGVRISNFRSINPKLFLARTMGSVLLTTGVMSAAQAADVGQKADDVLAFTDPVSLAMRASAGPLGGNCGMNVPSPYFPMDPDKGCNYDFDWNDRIQTAAAEANDAQLAEMFKQQGVCDGIQRNFEKYYPKLSGKVNCQTSPLNVKLSDGSSFAYKDNDYLITTGRNSERVGHYKKRSGIDEYSTGKGGEKVDLNASEFSKEYPDHWAEFNRLKAIALSVHSCCSDSGMRPPENECNRYGIRSAGSSNSNDGDGAI